MLNDYTHLSYMYVVIVPKSAQSLHLTVLRAVIR